MRNLVLGMCTLSFFLVVIMSGFTTFSREKKRAELEECLSYALWQTMENLENESLDIKSTEKMVNTFRDFLLMQLSGGGDIEIRILDADYEKRLLSVELVSDFWNWKAKNELITVQKIIMEDRTKADFHENKMTVTYWVGEALYRSYEIEAGKPLPVPIEPSLEGVEFVGWKQLESQEIYQREELEQKSVDSNMEFYAVTEEDGTINE